MLLDWVNDVFDPSNNGDPNFLIRARVALFDKALKWGIGMPMKMAPVGVGNTVIIQPRYPLGVDPVVMRELEAAADRRRSRPLFPAVFQERERRSSGMRVPPLGRRTR